MHLKDTIIIQTWSSKWHASLINTSQNVFIIIACDAFHTDRDVCTDAQKTHKPALSAQMCVYSKTQHIHTSRKAMLCCKIIPRFAGEQKSLPCSAKALRATTWDPHTTMCFINSEWRQTLSCCVCVCERERLRYISVISDIFCRNCSDSPALKIWDIDDMICALICKN